MCRLPDKGEPVISDEEVRQLYRGALGKLAGNWDPGKPLKTQFYRGVGPHFWEGQHPGSCERHMSVFSRFNVIPKYCFSCYKVFIEPRTVVELFKLMMVFVKLQLPNDNTRKCIVECREQVPGTYKGFVYCTGLDEGKRVLGIIRKTVSEQISQKIPVRLKRGCTEYAQAYPDYSPADLDAGAMEYNEDWKVYEDQVDECMASAESVSIIRSFNESSYTVQDASIMFAWLSYAAMIGDTSYRRISDRELPATSNIKRPSKFRPVED